VSVSLNSTSYKAGHRHSEAAREKMRLAKLGKSPANKGVPLSDETKEKLRAKLAGRVPHLRFAVENGRTLCEPCHKATDTFGGKARRCVGVA
jgi:hypothetical protein